MMNKLTNSKLENNSHKGRIFGLDILRTCAILFVVIGHGHILIPEKYRDTVKEIFHYDGVAIFFVLSGFLIGGILIRTLEKNNINKKLILNFWVRRWLRTLPNYYLMLTLLLILNLLFTEEFKFTWKFPLNFYTFTQNLYFERPEFFPESWSLSVEEWFYLIIPIAIYFFVFIKKNVKYSILFTAISILLTITLLRSYRYFNISPEDLKNFAWYNWYSMFEKQVITRLDSLMYGVVGAFIQYYHKNYWLKYKKPLFFIGIFLFLATRYIIAPEGDYVLYKIPYNSLYACVFSFSVIAFATLLLLPLLSDLKSSSKNFINSAITRISLISYSMYLVNLSLVRYWIIDRIDWNSLEANQNMIIAIKYFSYWFLTFSLSMILYKYVEIPFMNLRDSKFVKKLTT